jgi:hypothetical protein
MKQSEAARLVAVMIVAYPAQGSKLTPDQQVTLASVFADALSDFTYEQCNAALRVLIQTRQFMPTIAEIRTTVLDLERGPVRSGGDTWGAVLNAMKSKGAYRIPGVDFTFDDTVTATCVQRLGWRELCLSENTVSDRARFIELYDQLATQARREQQAPALAASREHKALPASTQQPQQVGKLIALVAEKVGGRS